MKVGIAFDLAPAIPPPAEGPDDRFEEFDRPDTIDAIAAAIRDDGHEVILLGDGRRFLEKILSDPPDFVFNIAEGEGVGRCREARVPAALEMLGIPYSGSDPLTLAACLDKAVARDIVKGKASGRRVKVPIGGIFPPGISTPFLARETIRGVRDRISAGASDDRRLILKPAFEGSSKGIKARCLVDDDEDAVSVLLDLSATYGQPILIEEFIDGDEVTVGRVGNNNLGFHGTMRIVPKAPTGPFVYSIEVKRDWSNRVAYETPARFPEEVQGRLDTAAIAVIRALGCRDVARIDFRIRDGIPYFIEANPLPGLAPGTSDLVILAEGYGIGHADLIRKILFHAFCRVGLR